MPPHIPGAPNKLVVPFHTVYTINLCNSHCLSWNSCQQCLMFVLINVLNYILTFTGGRDFVGEVVGVGQRVQGITMGQQVLGVVSPQRQGSHAEFVVTAASNVSMHHNFCVFIVDHTS